MRRKEESKVLNMRITKLNGVLDQKDKSLQEEVEAKQELLEILSSKDEIINTFKSHINEFIHENENLESANQEKEKYISQLAEELRNYTGIDKGVSDFTNLTKKPKSGGDR